MSKELKRNLRKEIDRPPSSILSLNPHGRYLCEEAINRIDELESALARLISNAEECDGWECFPSVYIDSAQDVLTSIT